MDKREVSLAFLRISMGLVFLYFSFQQLLFPDDWVNFVPQFFTGTGITANNIVMINAFLELVLGLFMIIGLYTRFSSVILSLHLFGIALSIGFSPIVVRDFGLSAATFFVFLVGADHYTLDALIERKRGMKKEGNETNQH